jgi:hypothetical protein
MNAAETMASRMLGRRSKSLALAISHDFDSRWIGELPITFEGLPQQCADYARDAGYEWLPDNSLLFGGRFEHPELPNTLFPV